MMKNIKYLLLGTIPLFFIFSCSDVEDLEPNNYESMVRAYAESFADVTFDENSEEEVILYATVWPKVSQSVSVDVSFSGTATEGTDYEVLTTGPISIDPTTGKGEIRLKILNDFEVEDEEDIIMTLVNPSGITLDQQNNTWKVIIDANDSPVQVELSVDGDDMVLEGATGRLLVNLSDPLDDDIEVTVQAASTSAVAGDDFTFTTSVTIPKGEEQDTIDVSFLEDANLEYDQEVVFSVASITTNAQAEIGSDAAVTYTIQDNSLATTESNLGFALVWDDLSTANVDLTLWRATDSDTVQVRTSNAAGSYESLELLADDMDGTYLVTAEWVGGTATAVDYVAYIKQEDEQIQREMGTLDMMNDLEFIFSVNKENTFGL